MKILGGTSRASVSTLRQLIARSLDNQPTAEIKALATDLFIILSVLSSSIAIRRALTDTARQVGDKSELISDLFGKKIGPISESLLMSASGLRWSSPSEIADAIEDLAVQALAALADKSGELDRIESELFDFARILKTNHQLRQILNSQDDSDQSKISLLENIVLGKYSEISVDLLRQIIKGRRGRSIDATLNTYSHYLLIYKNRLVAHVKSAIELNKEQINKLVKALSKQMGKPVMVNIEIDPKVLGGISVRYANDVVDGTIANRIVQARRAVVG